MLVLVSTFFFHLKQIYLKLLDSNFFSLHSAIKRAQVFSCSKAFGKQVKTLEITSKPKEFSGNINDKSKKNASEF